MTVKRTRLVLLDCTPANVQSSNTVSSVSLSFRTHLCVLAIKQGSTLSIWFTCSSGTWFWKFTCPAKIFTCPANICTSPVKLTYTAGKISTCPYWKITCPVGHVSTKVYVPWDKIYMPRACGHTLMSSPVKTNDFFTESHQKHIIILSYTCMCKILSSCFDMLLVQQ